jgi:hypothetical protein
MNLKDVRLKFSLDQSEINNIIKPAVHAFSKQFRIQYKKEVELVDNEDPSLDDERHLTIRD